MANQPIKETLQDGKTLLSVLGGKSQMPPPFWLMRQAGRYLPEYRELRQEAGGFLDMVYNPDRASEVTLQPIRRFGMDAAILFSDILVVPQALGRHLEFVTGEGPKLDPVRTAEDIPALDEDTFDRVVGPVYETVEQVRGKLASEGFDDTALIGFAGAPWTVACYMVEGGGSRDFAAVRKWAWQDPDTFGRLMDMLVRGTVRYLDGQIRAGAEVIQLFDSWSGVLDADGFDRWVVAPTRRIVEKIRAQHPDIPVIGFPRGAGVLYTDYAARTGVTAVGLDSQIPPGWARDNLQGVLPVQGNLDPLALLTGGDVMERAVRKILDDLAGGPFIFNLGHGVIKETPPEHVAALANIIREYR